MQNGRPLAYFSQSLGPKAAAQSTYHKEALAIIEALKKWRHYFLGNLLIIRTDHQSLKYMIDQRLAEGVQHKLLLKLLEFDYKIEYKKGKENLAADALSRRDSACAAVTMVTPSWITDLELSYVADPHCHQLIEKLAINSSSASDYTLNTGVLRYKGRICMGISTTLRRNILLSLHASAVGGHSGIRATYQRVKRIFYWPNLKKDVETFVSECAVCQRAKGETCHYPGKLQPLPIPDMAWSYISMDFVEGLPKSNGKDVILVVVDRLTIHAHFLPLSHPYTASSVASLFLDNIFKLHGLPTAIVTDWDRIFTRDFWKDLFKSL